MRSARTVERLPAKKIGLIHVARRQLGLAEAEYRAILSAQGGVESAADLDERGFARVVRYMTALGFRSTWTARTFGNRPGMARPAQVELIRKLWAEYHGSEDDASLNAWLAKFHHVSALRFVTAETAKAVIPGLRAMAARKASDAAKGSSPASPAREPRINRVSKGVGRAKGAKMADGNG